MANAIASGRSPLAEAQRDLDHSICRRAVRSVAHGAALLPVSEEPVSPHCSNAGALATAGFGTALACPRGGRGNGKRACASSATKRGPFFETRDVFTAWESDPGSGSLPR